MTDPQERRIVQGLQAGDPEAWQSLHDAHFQHVWRSAARILGSNSTDVADVVQETFLAAARTARSFDPNRGSLWMWLWGILRHQLCEHFRVQRRQDRIREAGQWLSSTNGQVQRWLGGGGDEPTQLLEAEETATLVRVTLTQLSEDYEMLLTARYLDDSSVDEIAELESSTKTAVRSKLARARRAFRQRFEQLVNGSPVTAKEKQNDS